MALEICDSDEYLNYNYKKYPYGQPHFLKLILNVANK